MKINLALGSSLVSYPFKQMSAIDEKQVIQFLRSKASALNAAADVLEGKIPSEKSQPVRARSSLPQNPDELKLVTGYPTASELRARVARKSARIADLAREFKSSDDIVANVINSPGSGLTVAERGWVKLDEIGFE